MQHQFFFDVCMELYKKILTLSPRFPEVMRQLSPLTVTTNAMSTYPLY